MIVRFIYRTDDGKRCFVMYAASQLEALALVREVLPDAILANVERETEAQGREWERNALKSRQGAMSS